jgi:hypothetical protein
MQDVSLYKLITIIDPGSKGQGHRRPRKGKKKDQITRATRTRNQWLPAS